MSANQPKGTTTAAGPKSIGDVALASTLRTRLVVASLIVAITAATAIFLSLRELSTLRTNEFDLTNNAMPFERHVSTAALAAARATYAERAYYLTGDQNFVGYMRKYGDTVVHDSLSLAESLYSKESLQHRAIAAIRSDFNAWKRERDATLELFATDPDEAITRSTVSNRELRRAYEEEFTRTIEMSRDNVFESHMAFENNLDVAKDFAIAFSVIAVAGAIVLLLWLTQAMRRNHQSIKALAEEEADAHAFERQLNDAMEMAESPEDVYGVVHQALPRVGDSVSTELLLADSSEAHLGSVASNISGAGCPVTAMWSCPAIRRGRMQITTSSRALDACPRLRDADACSATCMPVMFMGKAMGVMHSREAEHHTWSATQLERIRQLSAETGTRLGVLRAMAQSQLQASTDSLTGLANRRTLETRVRDLVRRGVPFAVAMCDVDNFKTINDTYGHDTGDRALRRFARILKEHIRKYDIVARFGGDEFVLVLPEIPEVVAIALLERVRTALAEQDREDRLPDITASIGLCASTGKEDFKHVLDSADQALLQAKRAGRNRVVCGALGEYPAPSTSGSYTRLQMVKTPGRDA